MGSEKCVKGICVPTPPCEPKCKGKCDYEDDGCNGHCECDISEKCVKDVVGAKCVSKTLCIPNCAGKCGGGRRQRRLQRRRLPGRVRRQAVRGWRVRNDVCARTHAVRRRLRGHNGR